MPFVFILQNVCQNTAKCKPHNSIQPYNFFVQDVSHIVCSYVFAKIWQLSINGYINMFITKSKLPRSNYLSFLSIYYLDERAGLKFLVSIQRNKITNHRFVMTSKWSLRKTSNKVFMTSVPKLQIKSLPLQEGFHSAICNQ